MIDPTKIGPTHDIAKRRTKTAIGKQDNAAWNCAKNKTGAAAAK
jgi:hypothetical protein